MGYNFHLIEGYEGYTTDGVNYVTYPQDYLSTGTSKEAGSVPIVSESGSASNNYVNGTTESIAMYKSVKDNKGFYIARYEAGTELTDEQLADYSGSPGWAADELLEQDGTIKPLSKAGLVPWAGVCFGGSVYDTASDGLPGDDTADGAVKISRGMYTKSESCGVTSTLCYGVQWDAVVQFTNDPSTRDYDVDGTIKKTGQHAVKNIYDLAGNLMELTMEGSDQYRIARGGLFASTRERLYYRIWLLLWLDWF